MAEKGEEVSWKWGKNEASGEVEKTSTSTEKITSKGNEVKRKGTKDDKAVKIKQDDGTKVLKKESELS